jgi:hypothetical protein
MAGEAKTPTPVIASERSNPWLQQKESMDCFVASLLAMTASNK